MKEEYITDAYDSVYEYDTEEDAYVFIGKLNGDTLEEFIRDYEEQISEVGVT